MKIFDIEDNDYKVYEAVQLAHSLSNYLEDIYSLNIKRKNIEDATIIVNELDRVIEPMHILNDIIVDKLSDHQKESENIVNSILHSTNEVTPDD